MVTYAGTRKRPGIYPAIVNRGNDYTAAASSTQSGGGSGGGGGTTTAGVLTLSDDGVLIYTGAAPKMNGTTLVYTPTPVMAGTVLTIS